MLDYNALCVKDTGFFFLSVSIANELLSQGRCSEMDALLDLWINTVYNDTQVQGSDAGPVLYLRNGTGNSLLGYAELAQRWGVLDFGLDEEPFFVHITEAECFPQAYAAAIPVFQKLRQMPKAVIVDIGGFTAFLMKYIYTIYLYD